MQVTPRKPIKKYSAEYFAACGIGGILACGVTHTLTTPLDVIKVNIQANPKLFSGSFQALRFIYSGQAQSFGLAPGLRGIVKGWGPTAWGYSLQGLGKYGLYEIFEHKIGSNFSDEDKIKYRHAIHFASSASAEFFADIALCPFEAIKVRIQANPTYARGLLDGLPKMIRTEGFGNLYAGIAPLWARQIPYTIIKFVAFEEITNVFYRNLKPKSEMNTLEQMGVVFSSGYLAGVLSGAVSHPADTMVSKINSVKLQGNVWEKMKYIYYGTAEHPGIGFAGLWKGFAPRVIQIGTLTGFQWFIYGAFKAFIGLETPGGGATKKH